MHIKIILGHIWFVQYKRDCVHPLPNNNNNDIMFLLCWSWAFNINQMADVIWQYNNMSMYAREILSWSEQSEKKPVPPEDSILCKIMHNWQEFKIMHNWQEFISTVSTHRQNSYTSSIVTSKLKDLQFRIEPCHDPEIKKNENNNWNNPHFNRY